MKIRSAGPFLAGLALILALPACSTLGIGASEGDFGTEANSTLIVVNNLEEAHTLEIFLAPAVGPRRAIGTVPPGRTVSLDFLAPVGARERVQFIAEASTGGEFARATTPITVDGGESVVWNVQANETSVVEVF